MGLEIQLYGPEHKERPQRWCLETPKEGVTNTEARELCKKMLIFYEAVSFLIRERTLLKQYLGCPFILW
jgi:hypothetical protein